MDDRMQAEKETQSEILSTLKLSRNIGMRHVSNCLLNIDQIS